MRRTLLGGGALTILLMILLVASPVEAQKGKGPAQSVDSDKLNAGVYTGILTSVPSPGGNFTLRVEIKKLDVPKINPNQFRPTNRNDRNRNRNDRNRNRNQGNRNRGGNDQQRRREEQMRRYREAMQQQMRMLQQIQRNTKVVTEAFNIEMQAGQTLVVRTLELPFVYDEKGNPKEYTPEEIRKMKGSNPSLPGYEATPESLRAGQIVQVALAPAKGTGGKRVQATTIMILDEGDLTAPDDRKGKKKK
jgi:hypothetical protein